MSDSMLRITLTLSAALHAALGMWVEVRGVAAPPELPAVVDSWSGPGIEVDTVPLAEAAEASVATTSAPMTPTPPPPANAPNDTAERAESTPREAANEATAQGAAAAPHPAPERMTKPHVTRTKSANTGAGSSPSSSKSGTPASVAATATSSASAPDSSSPAAATGAAFGAAGLPLGVRHLPKAFTRALSIADRSDARWLALPPGPAGDAHIEIPVDEDGKLGELAYVDPETRSELSPVVRHLLENTRLLLESGHFSLDPAHLSAGVQRLRVRVEVVERPSTSDPDADPNELNELEYEAPSRSKPGRGSFALNSGRRVIGWVYLE